jgi:spermidine synthase
MKHKRRPRQSVLEPLIGNAGQSVPGPLKVGESAVREERNPSAAAGVMFWMMPALSGFACLIYQILWMRHGGVLLGNTSHAAALTLAVFFGGLSMGGWYWGERCRNNSGPLRTYAWLELGIAAAGIALLIAPAMVPHVYPMLYQDGGKGLALTAFKVISTLLMVFPASFLMGGTLPLLGQAVIRRRISFGTITARIYAVNTMGAACGAFATAFLLIWLLGLRMTCVTAMGGSIAAALLAFRLSQQTCFQNAAAHVLEEDEPGNPQQRRKSNMADSPVAGKPVISRPLIAFLAFVSGFNLLALEVVWTRMLAQLHENSVYGFATVLIVVLVCLSLGAWLASRLARSRMPAPQVLLWLFALGGTALAMTPLISMNLTEGMKMLATDSTFAAYVLRLFVTGCATIGLACLPLGAVFPFLMKGEERFITHAGNSIGMLSAINTIGAILGSLAAGFLLLEWLGVWHTIQWVSAIYLIVAVLTPAGGYAGTYSARIASGIMLVLLFTGLDPSRLPGPSNTDPTGEGEKLVEKWEGSDGTVTVVEKPGNRLSIKINSNYSLGSTDAYAPQIFQARIPLLAYPASESVFFLGMGTGITAGEALNREDFKHVEKVVACELSANVVAASKKYFTGKVDGSDPTNGLYQDPRAEVVIGDGRNHLLANRERYSMINADLFLPYRRGTGNLYSREHFQIVRERLKPGGVFVQWLPLYQMTEREFGIIAHTMIIVFPQVSLWRGNFQPGAEIAALVGHADHTPLPASTLDAGNDKRLAVEGATHLDMQELMLPINEQTILFFYGGNLTRAAGLFEKYPLNTDDKPVIEFGTPRSLHQPAGADRPQFLETRFASLVDKIQTRTPPDEDPMLVSRSPSSRKLPLAGSAFHRGWIARVHGNEETWMKEWQTFLDQWMDPENR